LPELLVTGRHPARLHRRETPARDTRESRRLGTNLRGHFYDRPSA
jgi:hypothetical protein